LLGFHPDKISISFKKLETSQLLSIQPSIFKVIKIIDIISEILTQLKTVLCSSREIVSLKFSLKTCWASSILQQIK